MLLALTSLFLWSFLAATVLPFSSEAPLIVVVRTYHRVAAPVLVATVGNYLGACTTYWLARRAARAFAKEHAWTSDPTRAARLLRRFGQPALALSWVPIIGDALVALAGAMRMPFKSFTFWVALGKALRYMAVAWAASTI